MSGAEKAEQGGSLDSLPKLPSPAAELERLQHEGAQVFSLDCDNKAGSTAANDLSAQLPLNPAVFLHAD